MVKRIVYLGYYFKKLDRRTLKAYVKHTVDKYHISPLALWFDMICSSVLYNISLLEYFNFHFYKLRSEQRKLYAGTGFMYEYQLKMNPRGTRSILADKLQFLKEYQGFVRRDYRSLSELQLNDYAAEVLLKNKAGKIVLKRSDGQCGEGIEVVSASQLSPSLLIQSLQQTGNDLAEEFVVQHNNLMKLSPAGLNTIRIITQLDKEGKVDILGARLRISINSPVDNLAAGNVAAPVDIETGIVTGPGVYSDMTKQDEHFHPVTKLAIVGFQIPYWKETIKMIRTAALHNTANKSIGWDVAITNDGPELIEGNHDWCKLLWQLPTKNGMKPVLVKYLKTMFNK